MRRFEGLDELRPGVLREPVCAVGAFDGVHRGHRQLLYELEVWAGAVGGESCIITFPRHPLEVLKGVSVDAILALENRLVELERHGVGNTVVLDFAGIRNLTATEFLRDVLKERLGCRRLLLGFDSRLGKDRDGTPATLPELGRELEIEVRIASAVLDKDGRKIGSSSIREAIRRGELATAANLLGRPVTLRGTVAHGAGRGRELGTATANVEVGGQVLPPDGVYVVRVYRGAETAPGVANLGVRPTFEKDGARCLEVHVPGWTRDMYGEVLEIRIGSRLRDELRFETREQLSAQVELDLQALARAVARGEV